MILDFDRPVIDIDDKPMPGTNIAQILARHLAYGTAVNSQKAIFWAKKLRKGEALDLDPTDQQMLKTDIHNMDIPNITKANALEVFSIAALAEIKT